jgi:hypothetical protein
MKGTNKKTMESCQIVEMTYDYENDAQLALHAVASRLCHIYHMLGVELTQSYQLIEFGISVCNSALHLDKIAPDLFSLIRTTQLMNPYIPFRVLFSLYFDRFCI